MTLRLLWCAALLSPALIDPALAQRSNVLSPDFCRTVRAVADGSRTRTQSPALPGFALQQSGDPSTFRAESIFTEGNDLNLVPQRVAQCAPEGRWINTLQRSPDPSHPDWFRAMWGLPTGVNVSMAMQYSPRANNTVTVVSFSMRAPQVAAPAARQPVSGAGASAAPAVQFPGTHQPGVPTCEEIAKIDAGAASDFSAFIANPIRGIVKTGNRVDYPLRSFLTGTDESQVFVGPETSGSAGTQFSTNANDPLGPEGPAYDAAFKRLLQSWLDTVSRCYPSARHTSRSKPARRWELFDLPTGNEILLRFNERDPREPRSHTNLNFTLAKGKVAPFQLIE